MIKNNTNQSNPYTVVVNTHKPANFPELPIRNDNINDITHACQISIPVK